MVTEKIFNTISFLLTASGTSNGVTTTATPGTTTTGPASPSTTTSSSSNVSTSSTTGGISSLLCLTLNRFLIYPSFFFFGSLFSFLDIVYINGIPCSISNQTCYYGMSHRYCIIF